MTSRRPRRDTYDRRPIRRAEEPAPPHNCSRTAARDRRADDTCPGQRGVTGQRPDALRARRGGAASGRAGVRRRASRGQESTGRRAQATARLPCRRVGPAPRRQHPADPGGWRKKKNPRAPSSAARSFRGSKSGSRRRRRLRGTHRHQMAPGVAAGRLPDTGGTPLDQRPGPAGRPQPARRLTSRAARCTRSARTSGPGVADGRGRMRLPDRTKVSVGPRGTKLPGPGLRRRRPGARPHRRRPTIRVRPRTTGGRSVAAGSLPRIPDGR